MSLSTIFTRLLPRAESATFLARELYAPQTKILEGGTKDEIRIFDGLFNGTWPKLSTHALQKCFDNPHFLFCSSFQNLRLGGVNLHWETTFPRLTPDWVNDASCIHSAALLSFVSGLAQSSGVGKYRNCCFPHGAKVAQKML